MLDFTQFLIGLLQAAVIVLLAPLFSGLARVLRAKLHSRRGPGLLQNYRDIVKLLKRQDVRPAAAGWIFQATPLVWMGCMLLIAVLIPIFSRQPPLGSIGDLIAVVYLFALARFFFALAGVDSSNSFAGLGANREMTLAVLVEPVMMLALFVVALLAGSTHLGVIGEAVAGGGITAQAALWLGALAFVVAAFVEAGKLPYDLAEAEQELQEGPLAEYSGPALALLKWGLAMKQLLIVALGLAVFLPFGSPAAFSPATLPLALALFVLKALALYSLAAVVENGMARVRFRMAPNAIWVAFGMALLSFVFYLAQV